ncbi:hypothetical protein EsDP_00005712 [Epichloe bromicola]|uniref:Uncharacterized protein n=1 Tax=Epichloe bromicola TaxID=79588 RepID=A0ABQ0CVI4_9HYPO
MDARWTSRCDETQNANCLPANFGQLSPAASTTYYPFPQDLSVSSISPQALHWGSTTGQRAMPRGGKASKVTKLGNAGRRASRQSSLPSTAQDQLGQFAQQASSDVNHDAAQVNQLAASGSNDHPDNAIHLTSGGGISHDSTSIAGLHSSMQNAFDTTGGGFHLDEDEHHLAGNMTSPSHSSLGNHDVSVKNDHSAPVQTAADIVLRTYQSVKIDSTLCKKLAGETARREPAQRRRDQKLNIERRSNVEALLAHVTGEVADRPCKNCHKGHGPWTQCVVYDGQMCGSCTNCWFNASGSRCTFHENNNPQPSLFTPTAQTPSVQPGPMINFQQPSMLSANSPSVMASFQADVALWGMGDPTRRMINSVMGDTIALSKKDRYIARIEAAAKELGMRIAEFDEFLQTPEGIAEQQREQQTHVAQQSQTGDVSMDGGSPGAPSS